VVVLADDAGSNKPTVAGCEDLSRFSGKGRSDNENTLSEDIQMEI